MYVEQNYGNVTNRSQLDIKENLKEILKSILTEIQEMKMKIFRKLVTNKPTGKVIDSHWIFTIKFDGNNKAYKARLVDRGFKDQNPYDLSETHDSPVTSTPI